MTAKDLRDKFESDLKLLQDSCRHEIIENMLNEFAPGHYTGTVEVCINCEKIIN